MSTETRIEAPTDAQLLTIRHMCDERDRLVGSHGQERRGEQVSETSPVGLVSESGKA